MAGGRIVMRHPVSSHKFCKVSYPFIRLATISLGVGHVKVAIGKSWTILELRMFMEMNRSMQQY